MTIGDFAGLVELPEAAEPVKRPSPSEPPKAKRTQLRRYDHFACQVNNHLGVSMIKDAAPSDVWPAMCNGNHSVAYFHEFCSTDPAQRGVGWSKFGELFTALAEPLSSQAMQTIVTGEVLLKCQRKYALLKPHFEVLNGGKYSAKEKITIYNMATPMNQERKDEGKVREAVRTIVNWAKEQGCPLRALIAIMSYGGIWHNALVYDKVLRATVDAKGGGLSVEELQEAAVKRLCQETRSRGADFDGVETSFNR